MGIPKQKWTSEEEEALRAGVRKHGTGKWMNIQRDPEFRSLLSSRSNIDLKDKWRNLTVSASNGSIPRDKWRTQKPKPNPDVSAGPFPIVFRQPPPPPTPSSAPHEDASTDVNDDTSSCKIDLKTASKYDAMIYEALLEVNDLNGSDISTIVSLIEKKHDVAPNFRRLVCPRLRRLVAQGKLEKVDNSYRMKGLIKPPPQPQSPKPRDLQMTMQVQSPGNGDTIDEASLKVASYIADIENKTFVAAEAVKEAERVSRMCEDAYAFLDFANDIFEKSLVGEIELKI